MGLSPPPLGDIIGMKSQQELLEDDYKVLVGWEQGKVDVIK